MSRRVVITGMGAITPIGNTVDEFWANARKGEIGVVPITKFDTSDYKVKVAGEVRNFDAREHMDPKAARRMEAFSQYAVAASNEALADSGIDLEKEDSFRIGVCVGSGIGSMQALEREHTKLTDKGPNRVSPLMIPMLISNMAAGNIAIRHGLRGKNINVVTACATGTHCIGEAFRSIAYGEAEMMVTGGADACITPLGMAGFTSMKAVTSEEDPKLASIPFDIKRSGFVMGEGAGILVLEELEHAKKRGATIYAEMAGYGATCDAYHITSPAEDGSGAATAMRYAIEDAGMKPEQIDYINMHGTSTHMNDLFETRAVKTTFGEAAGKVKVNSTKSMTGHLLGAAGGVEAIACVKSIQDSYLHVNAGMTEQDPECDLDVVAGEGIEMEVNVALSNSLGFGGHNASIVIKKYIDK